MTSVEERLSLAETHLETLDRTLFRQQQQIDQLQAQLRMIWQHMQASPDQETRNLRDDIPPHY